MSYYVFDAAFCSSEIQNISYCEILRGMRGISVFGIRCCVYGALEYSVCYDRTCIWCGGILCVRGRSTVYLSGVLCIWCGILCIWSGEYCVSNGVMYNLCMCCGGILCIYRATDSMYLKRTLYLRAVKHGVFGTAYCVFGNESCLVGKHDVLMPEKEYCLFRIAYCVCGGYLYVVGDANIIKNTVYVRWLSYYVFGRNIA